MGHGGLVPGLVPGSVPGPGAGPGPGPAPGPPSTLARSPNLQVCQLQPTS
jgi:hypothetical protein